jgi:hypothetical protein
MISELQKWECRHLAGAILSGIYIKTERERRGEMGDTLTAAAVRADSTASFFSHVCDRFKIKLEETWVSDAFKEDYDGRVDVLMSRCDWETLRAVVEENASLVVLIARDGPIDEEFKPQSEPDTFTRPAWTMPVPTGDLIPIPALRTVWTSQSDMSHGADSVHGNVILFRREPLIDLLSGKRVNAPFIAGNSIRHTLRELAIHKYYSILGLQKNSVIPEIHHALTSGGTIEAGTSGIKVDPGLRAELRRLCPAFELLGGVAHKQMCHGVFNVHDARLVCRENASMLMDPNLYPPPEPLKDLAYSCAKEADSDKKRKLKEEYGKALASYLPRALEKLTIRQYTKHVDPDVKFDGERMHMLFDVEVAVAGSQWIHYVTIKKVASPFALSCVSDLLAEFAEVPYVAGGASRGHGLVAFDGYAPTNGAVNLPGPELYLKHIEENKSAMVEWLTTGHASVVVSAPPMADENGEVLPDKKKPRSKKTAEPKQQTEIF